MADVPSVIGGDFDPFTAPPSPGAAALNGKQPDDPRAAFFNRALEREEELSTRERELYEKRETEEAPMRQNYERLLKDFSRTSNIATERMIRGQEDIPKFDRKAATGDIFAMVAMASTFGALAGGLARGNATLANNAFAGMLNGFAKGQITLFDEKYKEWQANTDRALEINRRMVEEYKAVLANKKIGLDAQANLMQMTANKWQDQIQANNAQQRDLERMTQWVVGNDRANEGLALRKKAVEAHVNAINQAAQQRVDQLYGSQQDITFAKEQILNLQSPMPSPQQQARYPWLRKAAQEALKENPSYKPGDYDADKALRRMIATADVQAMRSALTKSEQMQSALNMFEPLARQAGRTMLALIGKTDPTGTNTFNKWVNAGRKATGDPDVAQFDAAMRQYQTEVARIINNPNLVGVLSDSARHEASAFTPEGVTESQLTRLVPFIENEMDYRQRLVASNVSNLQQNIRNAGEGKPTAPFVNPEPPPLIPPPLPGAAFGGGGEYELVEPGQ